MESLKERQMKNFHKCFETRLEVSKTTFSSPTAAESLKRTILQNFPL